MKGMMRPIVLLALFWSLVSSSFFCIPLGTSGGNIESDLTSFAVASTSFPNGFVSLDAGNILSGLRVADDYGMLRQFIPSSNQPRTTTFLQNFIKGYFISHSHLDHLEGLVINSVDDSNKPIYSLNETLISIRDHIFNGKIWANFANEGVGPYLNKYKYVYLSPGEESPVEGTNLTVRAFPLCHSNCFPSTAFLVKNLENEFVLYFGDTGPDAVEKSNKLQTIWTFVAPLVANGSLLGIFLESSYDDSRPDSLLFGHLTPNWIIKEMSTLAYEVTKVKSSVTNQTALQGLSFVVSHIKPVASSAVDPRIIISEQLAARNTLGIKFYIPKQGVVFTLSKEGITSQNPDNSTIITYDCNNSASYANIQPFLILCLLLCFTLLMK